MGSIAYTIQILSVILSKITNALTNYKMLIIFRENIDVNAKIQSYSLLKLLSANNLVRNI